MSSGLIVIAVALAGPPPALAKNPSRRALPAPQAPGPAQPLVKATIFPSTGQIVAIWPDKARLVIRCNPLKAVGWTSRTREFSVVDQKLLKSLKKGDRVKFDLRFEGQKYIIVDIDKR
ncbi:MAG: copper-binding protein [Deltaproteobacteria bacterium]|jgi:Cu/Ag efflux protein CusF|nr:copper-binding protein [Deltaproteobacteria bacterium]